MSIKLKEREMYRTDFDQTFLEDVYKGLATNDNDPRNKIGKSCGYSFARALQIWQDRVLSW